LNTDYSSWFTREELLTVMADKVLSDARIQLKDRLTLPTIKQLLDDLRMERVLNEEEVESILEENPARADKARNLVDSVSRKGPTASSIMLAKLKIHDGHLYNELKLDKTMTSSAPGAPGGPSISEPDRDGDKTVNFLRCFFLKKEYSMTSVPQGFCVIINNEIFENSKMNRSGSDKDAEALKKVFTLLGFDVHPHSNLKAKEMTKLMLEYSKKKGHGDCFVCCVLSHGEKNGVYGVDSKLCPMKDILSPFDGKNCPSLAGKPKLFFIQACRGQNREEKVEVSADDVAEADDFDLTSDAPGETCTIPKHSDFLVSMSTVEDFVSYRSPTGSWFIQALCKHLEEGSQCGEDIMAILTKVNDEVSRMEGKEKINTTTCDAKMTPDMRSFTLRKKMIFRIP
ncbi:hypothetical protein NFI96_016329, partial [Prochilodus magdalenae]